MKTILSVMILLVVLGIINCKVYDKLSECIKNECDRMEANLEEVVCAFRVFDYNNNHDTCLAKTKLLTFVDFGDPSSTYDLDNFMKKFQNLRTIRLKTDKPVSCESFTRMQDLNRVYVTDNLFKRFESQCYHNTEETTVYRFTKTEYESLESHKFFRLNNWWLYVFGIGIIIIFLTN